MRRTFVGFLVILAVISGCARDAELLKRGSLTTNSNVFQEVLPGGGAPSGYSVLTIYCSLKTQKPGNRLFDNSKRGTPDYSLLINIDGQAAQINGTLKEDNFRKLNDPESGAGIRYVFMKKVLIRSGRHNLIIASPEDGIAVEVEIDLTDGTNNYLRINPRYGGVESIRKPRVYGGGPSFVNGMTGFDLLLNGRYL